MRIAVGDAFPSVLRTFQCWKRIIFKHREEVTSLPFSSFPFSTIYLRARESSFSFAPPNEMDPVASFYIHDFVRRDLEGTARDDVARFFEPFPKRVPEVDEAVRLALMDLGKEFSEGFAGRLENLFEELSPEQFNDIENVVTKLMDPVFDETIRWSHIVTFFKVGSDLVIYCYRRGLVGAIKRICLQMEYYWMRKLSKWTKDHGGWHGLVQFNKLGKEPPKPDHRIRNRCFLAAALIAGVGLAYVLMKVDCKK